MISVIIPTRNRPGTLHRALRSLARQTSRDFEVIVIADGGIPPQAVINSWKHELPVSLLETDGKGVSHARNLGVATAGGEYLAFLDDDDIFLPRHLEIAHRALTAGHAEVVYGGALVSPRWVEAVPRHTAALPRKNYAFDDDFLLIANYIHTGSVVVRSFADTPVRFDEQMTHCEDWGMWLALRHDLGYRFSHLGECTSVYHQVAHASGAVATAYQTSPTPFTTARAALYRKWAPSRNRRQIDAYRAWFVEFDARLDARLAHRQPIPAHAYEHAIRALYTAFTYGAAADPTLLDSIIPPPGAPLTTERQG
ncbi:glycosyltransferase family A protein [Actinomadura sp. WMMB 499]|uniref:glycosyltransferase family 2 protein n=1 Tax=Actinomadura sp. WMMB 499 TaxID=1219491 RepID=UPI0012458A4F|nr:glycosyltransferase family A protein [Actinomadura sp. WMMB 499]QFG23728.1 glycosyltransferase family 2 protein [Actinomadura sp. WMMB 499]